MSSRQVDAADKEHQSAPSKMVVNSSYIRYYYVESRLSIVLHALGVRVGIEGTGNHAQNLCFSRESQAGTYFAKLHFPHTKRDRWYWKSCPISHFFFGGQRQAPTFLRLSP